MKKLQLAAILLLFFAASCVKETEETDSLKTQTSIFDFLFETTQEQSLDIEFLNVSGEAMPFITFELYSSNPYIDENGDETQVLQKESLVYKGNSGKAGQSSVMLSLPKYISRVYLVPAYVGLQPVYEIDLNSGFTAYTVLPAQRSASYKSSGGFDGGYLKNGNVLSYLTLGGWDGNGLPDYLEVPGDEIPNGLLEDINASLPESQELPLSHPQYLANSAETNLILEEPCEVWVTFVHEGAGWKNSLGYYTYSLDNPPTSVDDLTDKTVIFPNVSYANSGGGLMSGDKVQLQYYEPNTGTMTDTFPENIAIGWYLVANGWEYPTVGNGTYTHYSNDDLNIEDDVDLRRHNVLLWDEERELFLIGFEDIRRDQSSCDQDFNDAVFYATANPIEAIQIGNVPPIDDPIDTDGDGVSDVFDEYPEDPERAYNYYYPNQGNFATLAFEDLWPNRGDYDFNDLVIDYQYQTVTNAQNNIVDINPKFVIRAIGAGFHNGFGFQMDAAPSAIESISGQSLHENIVDLNANGTEANQSKAVVMVFDDAWNEVSKAAGSTFFNTVQGDGYVTPDTISLSITLSNPMALGSMGLPPYNPFIFVNGQRDVEVHLPGSAPTDLVDESLFGTGQDESDPTTGKYYFSSQDYPWAANIPYSFAYPVEKAMIIEAHLKFGAWASSNGYNYMDWYLDQPGYRNTDKIYSAQ